jgi:hypothetical protein
LLIKYIKIKEEQMWNKIPMSQEKKERKEKNHVNYKVVCNLEDMLHLEHCFPLRITTTNSFLNLILTISGFRP